MTTRTAVVTGSTSGIGEAIARRLHADGFAVVITGRDADRGEQVRSDLGSGATFIRLDLTDTEAPSRLAAYAVETFGRLDVLVNNAAIDHSDDLLEAPLDDIRRLFNVNSIATIAVLQECAKRMADGGSIINVTSRLASIGVPTMSLYSASKGSVKALTTAAAVELAPRNIRVNAVAPGMTRTPLYDTWLAGEPDPVRTAASVVEAIPLGRLAVPDDVAAAVSFLASDEASYITGASIPIDGGYTAR